MQDRQTNFVGKMLGVSSLLTTTVLNKKIGEVENKILIVSGLFMKTDYNSKTPNIEKKSFTTFDYSKFTKKILETKIKKKIENSNLSKDLQY